MVVYRLSKMAFKDDLKGIGAEKFGGRWNNAGVPILYTCEHRSLALLEVAVHVQLNFMPTDYYMIEIEIPDVSINTPMLGELPYNWYQNPPNHVAQEFGDEFVENDNYLALKVPSAIVKQEYNILINPRHRLASQVKIIKSYPFAFDKRLLN